MDENKIWDVVMVGAGPTALSAAIYTSREGIETILYEKAVIGGLAAITDWVDNYPGFSKGVAGLELAEALGKQAERFGAKIDFGEVQSIATDGDLKVLQVDGKPVKARSVLIATGSDYKKIGVPGEAENFARGVHYCATCDGAFYKDKRLVIIGGGNSAVQESLFLTRFASHIDLLVRSTIKASEVLVKELRNNPKITLHEGVTTEEIVAENGRISHVRGRDNASQAEQRYDTDGVFVFVGLLPNTQFLAGSGIDLDDRGFIKTSPDLETAIPGVFAAGDVRSGATLQIASASGEGATAALRIRKYLETMDRQAHNS